MRKKSHISLAKHIVRISDMKGFDKHKKALYWGSILPDCKPSFLTTRHEITGTIDFVERGMRTLTQGYKNMSELSTCYFTKLGEVLHYIADYFTFPHNKEYTGGFKDHCLYEGELQEKLNEYIRKLEKKNIKSWKDDVGLGDLKQINDFKTYRDIYEYLLESHKNYIEMERHSIEEDCKYIVGVCSKIALALIHVCVISMEPKLKLAPTVKTA